LKFSQILKLDESTPKISNTYSNTTYTNENIKLKLHHLPFNDMQSYDIKNENKNITLIDETNIYSPLYIKNIIKETYKLNNLQAISFGNFIASTNKSIITIFRKNCRYWSNTNNQIYFLKMGKQQFF
jgi:hypothetical protein